MLAIPIARIADRSDRSIVLTAGLALWSLATAVCGVAQNFAQLFVARMSVGIGEAAGVAPAYSLLTDLYPAERRARAMALFSLGIPLGSALGVVFGGLIAAKIDWRMAFIISSETRIGAFFPGICAVVITISAFAMLSAIFCCCFCLYSSVCSTA